MQMQGRVSLVFVKAIAERCSVLETTVTEWFRDNKIPARKSGKKWCVREDHLLMFQRNQHKMPPDYGPINNKMQMDLFDPDTLSATIPLGSVRPIQPFSAYETKGGWSTLNSTKFPNEWKPKISSILEKVPHYQSSYGNFVRDAVFNRILDMDQVLKESNMGDWDPQWEAYKKDQLGIEDKEGRDKMVRQMLKNARMTRSLKDREAWDEFVEAREKLVAGMKQPWKSKCQAILDGNLSEGDEWA